MLEQENTTLSQEQTEIPADLLPEAEGEKPEADALPAEPEKAAEPEERPEEPVQVADIHFRTNSKVYFLTPATWN